jgi:hypothetical protein
MQAVSSPASQSFHAFMQVITRQNIGNIMLFFELLRLPMSENGHGKLLLPGNNQDDVEMHKRLQKRNRLTCFKHGWQKSRHGFGSKAWRST